MFECYDPDENEQHCLFSLTLRRFISSSDFFCLDMASCYLNLASSHFDKRLFIYKTQKKL